MRNIILNIMFVTVTFISCKKNNAENIVETDHKKEYNANTQILYKSDRLSVNLKFENFRYIVVTKIGNDIQEYNLEKLKIPTKASPSLDWVNSNFACIMTWWSLSDSRRIFIPTNRSNKFIFIDKDIEQTDSINNTIVYFDTLVANKDIAFFKAENLLSRKQKSLSIKIGEKNGSYPFHDSIKLTKNEMKIFTGYETKILDISEITAHNTR